MPSRRYETTPRRWSFFRIVLTGYFLAAVLGLGGYAVFGGSIWLWLLGVWLGAPIVTLLIAKSDIRKASNQDDIAPNGALSRRSRSE